MNNHCDRSLRSHYAIGLVWTVSNRQGNAVENTVTDAAYAAALQPDEIEAAAPAVESTDRTMRCFEALPPWSHAVTNGVEIYTGAPR